MRLASSLAALLFAFAAAAQEGARLLVQSSPLAGFQYHAGEALWQEMREGDRLSIGGRDAYALQLIDRAGRVDGDRPDGVLDGRQQLAPGERRWGAGRVEGAGQVGVGDRPGGGTGPGDRGGQEGQLLGGVRAGTGVVQAVMPAPVMVSAGAGSSSATGFA